MGIRFFKSSFTHFKQVDQDQDMIQIENIMSTFAQSQKKHLE